MKYKKPELIPIGKALSVIQSTLAKNMKEYDSFSGPPNLTATAAYQSDE